MASSEPSVTAEPQAQTAAPQAAQAVSKKSESVLDGVLGLLSSVRFGIVMLVILLICSMIGMLVMQVEVDGFQEYYNRLTPAQRLIYGKLGFFQIYHSWYFTLLLAITGLNIILASIDRFPTAWRYISTPKAKASPTFVRQQMFTAEHDLREAPREAADRIAKDWRRRGMRTRISEERGRFTVFAQRNVWNRLGAYVVHVALLTIFTAGFLTSRFGVGGMMEIRPGTSSNTFTTFEMTLDGQKRGVEKLPFSIECTDIQQRLIIPEGGLEATNTIDWLSYVRIKDAGYEEDALVQLNYPKDYRGWRFFQSQFTPLGNARSIKVLFEPTNGGEAKEAEIARNGSAEVPGIGRVDYTSFFADFEMTDQGPTNASGDYHNPAAQLKITTPDGRSRIAFAFNPQLAEEYMGSLGEVATKGGEENPLLVDGHRVLLKDFEKVAFGHTLAVQYDPGRIPFYAGSTLLVLALCAVFFFSHQRVWAVLEADDNGTKAVFGGNTNRNRLALEGRFNLLVQSVVAGGGAKK